VITFHWSVMLGGKRVPWCLAHSPKAEREGAEVTSNEGDVSCSKCRAFLRRANKLGSTDDVDWFGDGS
jgi:hypothetical protein